MKHDFTKFDAWNKAMDLARRMHVLTSGFPKHERFEMTSQLRRAALSVTANIAEGFGRYTYPDKLHKYVQARGELMEVMTYIYHAERIGYLAHDCQEDILRDCTEVHRLLNALISKMSLLSPKP